MKKRRKTTILTCIMGRIGYHHTTRSALFQPRDWNRFVRVLKASNKAYSKKGGMPPFWTTLTGFPAVQTSRTFEPTLLVFGEAKVFRLLRKSTEACRVL